MNGPGSTNFEPVLSTRHFCEDKYVPRVKEENNIEEFMRLIMLTGKPAHEMFVYLWGVSGLGKTWLLRYFQNQYYRVNQTDIPYPSFSLYFEFVAGTENLLEGFIQSLSQQIIAQFDAKIDLTALQTVRPFDPEDAFKTIRETISELVSVRSKHCFILLLDNIDIVEPLLWQEIENQFLKSMLDLPCLIVSTSQKQDPDWLHFEIWRRIKEMKATALPAFSPEEALQLLKLSGYTISEREIDEIILPLYSGSPRVVDLLAHLIDRWNKESQTKPPVFGIMDKLAEIIELLTAYLNILMPTDLQKRIAAIYPLRYYEDGAFRYMNVQLNPNLNQQPDAIFGRQLSSIVSETTLIWRDPNYKAYVTNPIVRRLLDNLALLKHLHGENDSYLKLHEAAIQMYWQKAEDTPKISGKYLKEIIFHCGKQFWAKKDTDLLANEIEQVIKFARTYLIPGRLALMQAAIGDDLEISQILPNSLYSQILQQLASVEADCKAQQP